MKIGGKKKTHQTPVQSPPRHSRTKLASPTPGPSPPCSSEREIQLHVVQAQAGPPFPGPPPGSRAGAAPQDSPREGVSH